VAAFKDVLGTLEKLMKDKRATVGEFAREMEDVDMQSQVAVTVTSYCTTVLVD